MQEKLNHFLADSSLFGRAMFKKILLATLIVIIGLWGAGYNVTGLTGQILHTADETAGKFSGKSKLDDGNWGEGTQPVS